MQEFRDNDRKSAILDFISAKFVIGYACVSPYILFFIHGQALFLSFVNITKLLKCKMAAKRPY